MVSKIRRRVDEKPLLPGTSSPVQTGVQELYGGPLVNIRMPNNAGGTGSSAGSPDEMLRNLFMLLKKVKR
jgi:hypothetical protein